MGTLVRPHRSRRCDDHDARQLDTTLFSHPGPTQYVCDSCVNEMTVRPPTPRGHTLPSRFAHIRRQNSCDDHDAVTPDTIFSHALPSRFARIRSWWVCVRHDASATPGHQLATPSPADSRRRLRRLAHPSHALAGTLPRPARRAPTAQSLGHLRLVGRPVLNWLFVCRHTRPNVLNDMLW